MFSIFQDRLPYEHHIARQMANKPLLFSRCLLRTQKLSESRSEGEIIESSGEGTEMLRTYVQRSTCFSCFESLLVLFREFVRSGKVKSKKIKKENNHW